MMTDEYMKDVRDPYAERVAELMEQVELLQHQMNMNIQGQLKNMETAESVLAKSQECMELAKVFKKRANTLKHRQWYKSKRGVVIGTALCSIAGGVGGFLVGGPAGAAVLTSMSSVAAAQAIEMSAGAIVCGTVFLGASSTWESWFINQRFIPLQATCGSVDNDLV